MIKVLFVCLGNICRSPMAEAIFRDLVKKEGFEHQISVDSAGTGSWHIGQTPHKGTIKILEKNNIHIEGLIARQIKSSDIEEFDYIVVMDSENKAAVDSLKANNHKAKVSILLDHVPHIKDKDIPDPYYTGNFQKVFDLVSQGCEALLQQIKADHF